MADVTGSIGNNPVELNNAATEATLRQLLQAFQASGAKNTSALNALAQNSGLNANAIQQANAATGQLTPQMNALGKASFFLGATFGQVEDKLKTVWKTGEQLASGTAQASQVLNNLATMLPPGLSHVVSGLSKLAEFQEEMLGHYQDTTKAGVNFGGSLTDMRLAASQAYMTMSEFKEIVAANSQAFTKMGGSADEGARSFFKAANDINKSELGSNLRGLGYTAKDVNQGLADYISLTGGRTREEMRNTKQLTEGATAYLEQLDGLAKLTGESREELAKKIKDDQAKAAFEAHLLTLDVKERERARAAVTEAEVRGGKGAAQALQAKLMGLPPMTEAAQKFVGTMQNGNQALDNLAAGVKDNTKTVDDMKRGGAAFTHSLAKDGQNLKQVGSALMMAGKDVELYGRAIGANNQAVTNQINTVEEQIAHEKKISDQKITQQESEAQAAVDTKKALEEMGQKILAAFLPVAKVGLEVVNALAPFAPYLIAGAAAVGVFTGALKAKSLLDSLSRRGGGRGGLPGGLPGTGGTAPPGGPPRPGLPGGAPGGPGIGARLMSGAKGGVAGLLGGMVLGAASDRAKEAGMEKTGAGLDIASQAASFAGTGAMLGSIVPGLGTVAGGVVGGLAGGAYGLYKNWSTFFGGKKDGAQAAGAGALPIDPKLQQQLGSLPPMTQAAQSFVANSATASPTVPTATPIPAAIQAQIAKLEEQLAKMKEEKEEEEEEESESPIATFTAKVETFTTHLERLNKQAEVMVVSMKEIAENTKRTVDATKSLNGDLFA